MNQQSRRDWLKGSVLALASLPFLGAVLSACTKKGEPLPEGQTALSESDPTAQALGYSADGSKVDTAKFPKKKEGDQSCANCAQYTSVNAAWGKCNIFPQGMVAAQGWCNSWVPQS